VSVFSFRILIRVSVFSNAGHRECCPLPLAAFAHRRGEPGPDNVI
jgi:hypothetical protein